MRVETVIRSLLKLKNKNIVEIAIENYIINA
ncbi:MAG: hypothetical protein IPL09_05875 [Bacteroidetes bacterium]|nr:hypothetical protein [Bacteroidota bacterium]